MDSAPTGEIALKQHRMRHIAARERHFSTPAQVTIRDLMTLDAADILASRVLNDAKTAHDA